MAAARSVLTRAMRGKTCIITGATSGIGLAAAEALAAKGASLVLIGRDRARGEAALARVHAAGPGVRATVHYADLLHMAEVRRLGAELLAAYPRIDVLVNNAGALFQRRELTKDGLERTYALNHVAYFLLTHLLRDRLVASSPARVVNVASRAHERASAIDFSDLEQRYSGWTAYCQSKLANILFTRELARRHRRDRELPTSGLCREPVRRQQPRRPPLGFRSRKAAGGYQRGAGSGNDRLSRERSRYCRYDRKLFRALEACHPLCRSAGRSVGCPAVGD
jgi:NAD(P)-dependent dehydrogenase (short-subunit alcohol dehydrogenase family)